MKDNSLFFLILSLGCFWLVLDEFYGHNYISQFIVKLIPKSEDNGSSSWFDGFADKNEDLLLNGKPVGNPDEHKTTVEINGEEKDFYWNGNNYVANDGSILQ